MGAIQRVFCTFSGIFGAGAVACYAAAAHIGGFFLPVGQILGIHAGVLLVLAFVAQGKRLLRWGGLFLILGCLLFAGDLLSRQYFGNRLFPYAAPSGGLITILGWFVFIIAGLTKAKAPENPLEL